MSSFKFKHFIIEQANSAMKVGTDAMILGAMIDCSKNKNGLDIGAGTGVLSLMVAQKNTEILIDSIDIDEFSVKECRFNFEHSQWTNRLSCWETSFEDYVSDKKYDLIFSNPPFYATSNLNNDARKAQARHQESLPAKIVLGRVNELLTSLGEFWVIIPSTERDKWTSLGALKGLSIKKAISIRGNKEKEINRVVICFDRLSMHTHECSFTVRNTDNSYSQEYIELTRNFHAVDLRK